MFNGFCDFTFGSAQNDKGGGKYWESESIHLWVTDLKGVIFFVYEILIDVLFIDFGLMFWVLIFNWNSEFLF